MKIKVTSGFAGDRFSFRAGQIIECPKAVGARLIAHGNAEEAPDSAQAEGAFDDQVPKEERSAAPPKKQPEKATTAKAEKATTGSAPEHCQGETKAGNPCLRAPIQGSRFCAAHFEEIP